MVDEDARITRTYLTASGGTERLSTIRTEMRNTMEEGAGIYRTEEGLSATCDKLSELRDRFSNISLDDRSLTYNTELISALELDAMLDVADAVAHSARARKESRGSHQRTDHPQRNDETYLRHSIVYRGDDVPTIDYKDVVITRWPPGERVYGQKQAE